MQAAGQQPLVEYTKKKLYEQHCQELRAGLKVLLDPEGPAPPTELVEFVRVKKGEWVLQDPDVVKVRKEGCCGSWKF